MIGAARNGSVGTVRTETPASLQWVLSLKQNGLGLIFHGLGKAWKRIKLSSARRFASSPAIVEPQRVAVLFLALVAIWSRPRS
jgi:hypothetical protein